MKAFMDQDFLLDNDTARTLFALADPLPIFDWHCHLSPKEIYENKAPANLAQLWLAGDHYKWRAMRSCGIAERYITGEASPYEKYLAWAGAIPALLGNPLYHWTHLELQRYFDIKEPLSPDTADSIWIRANQKIAEVGFTPRDLILRSNVRCLCTTDDPADSLEYHQLLAADDSFPCRVLPAFRPDKALQISMPGFADWLRALSATCGRAIVSYADLVSALRERIAFFDSLGCRASDHAFTKMPYHRADTDALEAIFAKALAGGLLQASEAEAYQTELLRVLAAEYAARDWGMEIHLGAMRNNNSRMFAALGPDTGYDSAADCEAAYPLSRLLDSLETEGRLPRTILFCLNPKDNYVLGSMLGNFQSEEAQSKLQFGTAWWINDNLDGMRAQMGALANTGALGKFLGMVTDSRSFLSYPRHEYFRRILCGMIGDMVEGGLYPNDLEALRQIIKDISYYNAVKYFGV